MGRRTSLLSADALWASEAQLKMRMLCQHLECQKKSYTKKVARLVSEHGGVPAKPGASAASRRPMSFSSAVALWAI